jgi:tRNA modification GTPase
MLDDYHQVNVDTIASRATATGIGSIGIVRISGSKAFEIGCKIAKKQLTARIAHFGSFYDANNNIIDEGIAIFFKGPHSFTGEDVVELQGHGGIIVESILKLAISYGARQSRPGEFTERAFLNDKIDLTQAEAIADLIESSSEHAARAAICSLTGEFSKKINCLIEELIHLRVYIEAAIDFPEEEIDFLADHPVIQKIQKIIDNLEDVLLQAKRGAVQREGLRLLIMGAPNVGKSSLMNALSGVETSIVTDIKGTTRDTIKEHINLDGLPIQIIDTAGLRNTEDKIEQIGINKTISLISAADIILFMVDQPLNAEQLQQHWHELVNQNIPQNKVIILRNKIDTTCDTPKKYKIDNFSAIDLAVKHQQGLDILTDFLKQHAGFAADIGGGFSARSRHTTNLVKAKDLLISSKSFFIKSGAPELLAEDLRQAQEVLGEITGAFSNDQLLGRIFADFCIGK